MEVVTIKEVAIFLKVKESTLYSWVHSEQIPSYKINGLIRFDMEEIRGWFRKSKKVAEEAKYKASKRMGKDSLERIIKKSIESVKGSNYNSPIGKTRRKSRSKEEV